MAQSDDIMKQFIKLVERKAIGLVLDIHGNLVEDTPVDTGWAENNWLPSVAAPIDSTAGTRESVDTAQQNAGVGEILRWRFEQGNAFLSNNVPYISRLNAGSSAQAPRMFVEAAIQKGVAKFGKAKLK